MTKFPADEDSSQQEGKTNFGDIMQANNDQLPVPPALQQKLKDTEWWTGDPYNGVVLTANGNLQRLMSAWYQSEIKVEVVYNREIEEALAWNTEDMKQYDRRVKMSVAGKVFCYATSRVILSDSKAVNAVEGKGVGIAQLYKHFSILPRFHLTDAGVLDAPTGCQLWREYVLSGGGIECRIREDFCPDYLSLVPSTSTASTASSDSDSPGSYGYKIGRLPSKGASTPHLGDLLKGTSCSNILDEVLAENASPLQRALLTAAGNFSRIFTSYYKLPLSACLLRSIRVPDSKTQHERSVMWFCNGIAVMRARSLVTLESPQLQEFVQSANDVGNIFRRANLLPDFELLQAELQNSDETPGFGRRYALKAPGVRVEIVEEFPEAVLHLSQRDGHMTIKGLPLIFKDFPVPA